jgi:plasmid maintenance system antidote protein VapI
MSADFWNNLQMSYNEDKARLEEKAFMEIKLEEEKEILVEIKD